MHKPHKVVFASTLKDINIFVSKEYFTLREEKVS